LTSRHRHSRFSLLPRARTPRIGETAEIELLGKSPPLGGPGSWRPIPWQSHDRHDFIYDGGLAVNPGGPANELRTELVSLLTSAGGVATADELANTPVL